MLMIVQEQFIQVPDSLMQDGAVDEQYWWVLLVADRRSLSSQGDVILGRTVMCALGDSL